MHVRNFNTFSFDVFFNWVFVAKIHFTLLFGCQYASINLSNGWNFECKNQTEVYYLFVSFWCNCTSFLCVAKAAHRTRKKFHRTSDARETEKLKPSTFADGRRVVNTISQLERSNFSSDLFWFSPWHRPGTSQPLFKHAPRPLSCLFPTTKLSVQPEPRCKPNKAERSHLFAYTHYNAK